MIAAKFWQRLQFEGVKVKISRIGSICLFGNMKRAVNSFYKNKQQGMDQIENFLHQDTLATLPQAS